MVFRGYILKKIFHKLNRTKISGLTHRERGTCSPRRARPPRSCLIFTGESKIVNLRPREQKFGGCQ